MLKIRVREYSPSGVKGRILEASNIEVTDIMNGSATLSFTVSQKVAGKLDAPIVAGVEYSVNGARFLPLPYNNLFVMDSDDSDDMDTSGMITLSGQNYLSWLLSRTYLHWSPAAKDGERVLQSAGGSAVSAGQIMHTLITEARDRGWGNQVEWNFTSAVDSAGNSWGASERVKAPWRLLTPASDILDTLAEDGLCEWRTSGLELQLYRPETMTVNRTPRVLGGAGFERTPIRSDASGIFTNLTVVPEKANNWLYLSNPGAITKFGRLEATMTQSGIESHTEATKLAQPHLAEGKQPLREESFEWTPSANELTPWHNLNVGDIILTKARGAKVPRRIVGIIVQQGENGISTVVVKAGEVIKGTRGRVVKRLGQATVGNIISGTGNSFPATSGPTLAKPNSPVGVYVKSNTARWVEGFNPQSTVEIEWSPVTMNTDGTESTVIQYEVWSRRSHETLTRDTATNDLTAVFDNWTSGELRHVAVRAQNDLGEWSDYSTEISVTPLMPSSIVPKAPTGMTVVSNVGSFTNMGPRSTVTVSWNPVTLSVEDTPVTVAYYNVWIDDVIEKRVSTNQVSIVLPVSIPTKVNITAVTDVGLEGDPSTSINVTGNLPSTPVLAPKVPTLKTGSGNVIATWDGTYTTPAVAGAHTVRFEARVGSSGSWEQQGAHVERATQQLITIGSIGDTVQVRLLAFDQLGRLTGTSGTATVVVQGVRNDDLDEALKQAVQEGREAKDAAVQNAQDILTLTDEQSQIADQAQEAWNQALEAMDAAVTGGGNIYPDPSFEYGGAGLTANNIWEIIEDPVNARQGTHVATQRIGWWGTFAQPSEFQPCSGADVAFAEAYIMRTDASQTGQVRLNIQTLRLGGATGASTIDSVYLEDIAVGEWHRLSGTIRIATASGEAERTGWRVYIYTPSTDSGGFIVDSVRHTNATQAYEALEAAQAAQDAASQAQSDATEAMTAADGKTRIWRSTLSPAASNAQGNTGDVWWRYSNSNFTGPITGQWTRSEPGAGGWQPTQIESEVIANLTVDKLVVTGGAKFPTAVIDTLVGDQAFIGSLYTNRVIVDSGNLAPGPGGYESAWTLSNQAIFVSSVDPSGLAIALPIGSSGSGAVGPRIPVTPDLKIHVEFYMLAQSSPNANINCRVYFYDSSGTVVENNLVKTVTESGWTEEVVTVPSGARYAEVRFVTYNSSSPEGRWVARNFNIRPQVGSVLIENGAITADKITVNDALVDNIMGNEAMFGRISADLLEPNIGDTIVIDGNLTIQGIQTVLDSAVEDIGTAGSAATAAQSAADIAASQALVADTLARDLTELFDHHQAVFRVTGSGAEISSSDGQAKLTLTPTGASISVGGTTASTWEAGRFIVNEIVINRGRIGNHVVEKSGSVRTVWRPI